MGSGIAQVMAIAGHSVVAYDLDPDVVAAAPALVAEGRFGIQGAVARGKMTEAEAEAALAASISPPDGMRPRQWM